MCIRDSFCTNLVARALDGYAVAALDFLVKPITENRLDDLLDKALRRLGPAAPAALTLHTQDTTAAVSYTHLPQRIHALGTASVWLSAAVSARQSGSGY